MKFKITARKKDQADTEYQMIEKFGIVSSVGNKGGKGTVDDPCHFSVRITNESGELWSGVIHTELLFDKKDPLFFLPGFMYGRNRGECPQNVKKEFPRIRDALMRPSSSWWMVRGDRLSHPTALVYDQGKITGFYSSPYFIVKDGVKQQWMPGVEGSFCQYAGYSCSLSEGSVGYTLGYENAPWLFVKALDVKERSPLSENCFDLEAGETVTFSIFAYEFPSEKLLDINSVIEKVYYKFHQKPRVASDVITTVTDLSTALSNDAWFSEDKNFSGQVFEDKINGGYRYNKIYSISWTNGLSAATPMLIAGLRLGNETMRSQALSCIENIIENSINPASGLPFESYNDGKWSVNGWWFDDMHTPGHSSYLVCQAVYYILKAYEYEKRLKGEVHDDWISFAKRILDRIEMTKNTDGEYPFIFSQKTGAGLEYFSFGSCWCMTSRAYYCHLTGDRSYIGSLERSERHYYDEYVKRLECYGTPLDTEKAVDSEGILAFLKASRYLFEITGDRIYLDHMKDALCYEFSFKFCYNSPVKIPPLGKIGWSSCGGSITSVANPHIHPMSNNVVDELLFFIGHCDDGYVRDRMNDTVGWGCQTYNTYDGEYGYGKKGWMSERFCYSEGLVSEKYDDGSPSSTWFCLMPWASASIIEGLVGDYWDTKVIKS